MSKNPPSACNNDSTEEPNVEIKLDPAQEVIIAKFVQGLQNIIALIQDAMYSRLTMTTMTQM